MNWGDSGRRRRGWLLILLILPAAIGFVGCATKPAESPPQTAASAAPAPAPAPAERLASSTPLEILSVLSVEREVDVIAQREGVVVEVLREVGAEVQADETLARLDDRDIVADLEKARAELDHQALRVKHSEADLRVKEADYKRALEMKKYQLISDADLEKKQFEVEAERMNVDSERRGVAFHEANVRKLELDLGKTRIRAPFAGVVVRRHLRLGQALAKEEKCFRLSELSPLLVRFLVPETVPLRLREGDAVRVVPVSDSDQTYTARIQHVSPVIDPASAASEVTAQLVSTDLRRLRPGMAVRVLWGREAKK